MRDSRNELSEAPEEVTVEHLLPQQGTVVDYPYAPARESSPDGLPPESRRTRLMHTIGNLTLLTQPLNSSISNGPFDRKRPEIAKNSDLRLNTKFQDVGLVSWSEDDIVKRGRELFTFAKNIWSAPV
jgi:hypothetical protein